MKILNYILGGLLIVALGWLLIIYATKKQPDPNYISVPLVVWDSLLSIQSIPPDTIIKDTVIFVEKEIKVIIEKPVPIEIKAEVKTYENAVKNDSIDVRVKSTVIGDLLGQEITYKPVLHLREVEILKPYPVAVNVPYEAQKRSLSVGLQMTGNDKFFSAGPIVQYKTKKNVFYQIGATHDTKKLYLTFGLGVRLF